MSQQYYDPKDLKDLPNIIEFAVEAGNKFFECYETAYLALIIIPHPKL